MSTLRPERIAYLMAVAVARGRLADLSAAEHALATLRTEAKYAVGEDEPRLRTIADHIWAVLVAGSVDVLDDLPTDQTELVAALQSPATPELLEQVRLGRISEAKRLWDAAGVDTSSWARWRDVEPDRPPASVADLDLPALIGLHVEVDVADHPDQGYVGRLIAARDDLLILAWNREAYGGITLVPTGRVLAVRVIDELLPDAMLDELDELEE